MEEDKKSNKRGHELISLCHDSGMIVLNGRVGGDKDKGAFTFVPVMEQGVVGEHYGSTIDVACIGARNFRDVVSFEVEEFEEKGKHAVIRCGLAQSTEHVRRDRGYKRKGRDKLKVCRPDVKKLAGYAMRHFQDRENHFETLHEAFEDVGVLCPYSCIVLAMQHEVHYVFHSPLLVTHFACPCFPWHSLKSHPVHI